MTWSDAQKALAVRACKGAGIDTESRELILRQLGDRAIVAGRATSTAPRLTQPDFNRFMAIVEDYSGGQVKVTGRSGKMQYTPGHWQGRQDDNPRLQLIHVAERIAGSLAAERISDAFITGTVSQAIGREIYSLDFAKFTEREARDTILALLAVARREGINLKPGVDA